jgi:putative tryptophan/tyrosine transport system substrate-binding protein
MRRREFIAGLSGATLWPVAAGAQRPDRMRRIGVLSGVAESDVEAQIWDATFRKRLGELGWIDGRNIHIDYRWGAGSVDRMQLFAKELVRLEPDVCVTVTTPATAAMLQETHIVPIVFVIVSDPVGSGFVESLANPGGNATGFINLEGSLSGRWLELLREIAPRTLRVAFLFDPRAAPYAKYYLDAFRASATALAIEPVVSPIQSAAEIEPIVAKLGPRDGLIVMPDTSMQVYRDVIVSLANRYRIPTAYPFRFFAIGGGLISYGINLADLFRGAASYVDRILRGENTSDLAVQLPTRFELIINLKTAKALGLTIPETLLATADEVIQ